MKNIIFLSLISFCCLPTARAQFTAPDATEPSAVLNQWKGKVGDPSDSLEGWHKGGLVSINLAQGSLQNWAAGGDNFSLSLVGLLNVYANYKHGKTIWDNGLTMAYGMLKTSSIGTQKTNDNFDLTSKYGYQASKNWYYSILGDFRTQFANGYLYPDDSTVVSHGLAPAYGLLALGMNYQPVPYFSLFLSPLTSRFVIVEDQRLADLGSFGVDSAKYQYNTGGTRTLLQAGKKLKYELGAFVSAQFNKEIMTNVTWTTRLDLFSNYLHDPQDIKVYWTSLLALKVNKFITASLNTELIYDNDILFPTYARNPDGSVQVNPGTGQKVIAKQSPRTQFKELFGLGFAYKF